MKFIIFAHHRVMLDAISDCLSELRVNYIRIDGQTRSDLRADYVDTFQKKNSCKVAVLSLKACNSGITLTAAEMIVFAELDWNPSVCIEHFRHIYLLALMWYFFIADFGASGESGSSYWSNKTCGVSLPYGQSNGR